ncbi:hypothetical protein LTR95_006627 [Oleoguttula sp. CCFEE 5521]
MATRSASPMPEAGILGNLVFSEETHGWALDAGQQLMRYDLVSGPLMDDRVPGISDARHELVFDINRWLERGQLSTRVPEIVPGERQIRDINNGLLSEMRQKGMQTHLACLLIGSSNFALGMADSPRAQEVATEHGGELLSLATNRLSYLDIGCPNVGIRWQSLLREMQRTPCNGQSIRQLLHDLQKPMMILSVTADPKDTQRLRLGDEHRELERALRSSSLRDAYVLQTVHSCRPSDLASALRRHKPTIIHFSGHGSEKGLCFQDEQGYEQTVDLVRFADLLRLAKNDGLRGVVMNACYSAEQAHAVAVAVGNVVAMEGLVSDQGAIDFARAFYGCLGDGYGFQEAYEWALAETGLQPGLGPLMPR